MSEPKRFIFHLLPNAHLDPVWLWDWREGLNEGLITVRTMLDLMDETPKLTFIRGESSIYEHIQKTDPATFKRIRSRIEEGRWDVVGGTVVQPDSNLTSTEILCRQYERGLEYFQKNLGVRPTVAWQADSFGHTPGFPNILSSFGMEGFSFTRPQQTEFPLNSPAFWWEGDWGNKILCYRQLWKWYCTERANLIEALDQTITEAAKTEFTHHALLFGLGNHGGGPSRRHLRELQEWQERHPEVEMKFDTLHGFFDTLKEEVSSVVQPPIPTLQGEFGYCLRGCYSSVQKFKSLYRTTEAQVTQAETARSLIGATTERKSKDLSEAWDALLFNSFHDILPGTSIERAMEEQTAWVGLASHQAQVAKFQALNQLTALVDTTVPAPRAADLPRNVPVLLWNSLSRPFRGLAEVEVPLDYRPVSLYRDRAMELPIVVFDHTGEANAFQVVDHEHNSMPEVPWRRRVVVPVEIPAFGWSVLQVGWRETHEQAPTTGPCSATESSITNESWLVSVENNGVRIERDGRNFFAGDQNLALQVVDDPWGSWGGMVEERDSYCLENILETWGLTQSHVLEAGPLRSKLWTRWHGANSWIDLTFSVEAGSPALRVEGRLLWNERSARLKLVLPSSGELEYDMPGGKVTRDAEGHVPGGRWVVRSGSEAFLGLASDVLSDFDASPDELRVTLARATRYACDVKTSATEMPWQPVVDCGELKFQLSFFGEDANADHVADELQFAPAAVIAPAQPGTWARQGSLGRVLPDAMRLLSIEEVASGQIKVRLQNRGAKATDAILYWGETCLNLGSIGEQQIQTFLLEKNENQLWQVCTDRKAKFVLSARNGDHATVESNGAERPKRANV